MGRVAYERTVDTLSVIDLGGVLGRADPSLRQTRVAKVPWVHYRREAQKYLDLSQSPLLYLKRITGLEAQLERLRSY